MTATLPQVSGPRFLTDSGLETDLIFNHGFDLPDFASFPLLADERGRDQLRRYYADHWEIAKQLGFGVVFDTPTWRANPDWGTRLGYDLDALAEFNVDAVRLLNDLKGSVTSTDPAFVISGNLGPRGDGYQPGVGMSVADATAYHRWQVGVLASSGVDLVSILTANYVEEAIGVANAAADADVPSVISFTVETDGRLPDGSDLGDAIGRVDAESSIAPAYFMVNCAHPTHLVDRLTQGGKGVDRIRGVRANASRMSHEELDAAESLDAGDPVELGELFVQMQGIAPEITIMGGCCGTDARHVRAIAEAVVAGT